MPEDQYTDRSGAALVKIAGRLKSRRLAKLALDAHSSLGGKTRTSAEFPCDTPKDVFLSRIYFEGQREKLASCMAEEIDKRLSLYETLHNIPNRVEFRKEANHEPEIYELLPECKVASKEELFQAGNDFSKNFEKLSSRDRRIFAENFVKVAMALDVECPDEVKLYAGIDVAPRPDMTACINFRKLAMLRHFRHDGGFGELCDSMGEIDTNNLPNDELVKIAETLDMADNLYNLRDLKACRGIPDAWHSVFMIKHAEAEEPKFPESETMSRADIIGRYGEGILEEIEDENGQIDRDRLAEILKGANAN